jgi:hypothetical protein
VLAAATFVYAKHQHNAIDDKTAILFKRNDNSPAELNRIRDELARLDLTKEQLAKELEGRMAYLQSLQGREFYISVDTTRKKLQLRIGKEVAREADVQIGEAKTLSSRDGKTWTFYPLKGAFNVVGKDDDYQSAIPEWVYALHNQPAPEHRPAVHNWLGHYVIFLPNNYVIHSPPENSPLQGPKPGSLMVPEADLEAIWPRITKETRVYIF